MHQLTMTTMSRTVSGGYGRNVFDPVLTAVVSWRRVDRWQIRQHRTALRFHQAHVARVIEPFTVASFGSCRTHRLTRSGFCLTDVGALTEPLPGVSPFRGPWMCSHWLNLVRR